LVWHVGQRYHDASKHLHHVAFTYALSVADGEPVPLDPKFLQEVQSDKFKTSRDNYRITKSVQDALEKFTGSIVYVDRKNRLTLVDLETKTLSKVESTYDLPKNYQEKYAMLKIMELDQPIEGVGIKIKTNVDDMTYEFYYLKAGDTVVTH
jgi:hypothetical protein